LTPPPPPAGSNWPSAADGGCQNGRLDPCGGCANSWEITVQCSGQRDLLRITEIYILGKVLSSRG
jgi:hypothetical protein